ncbi:hypothetical protein NL533_30490, partial [Klebsiella pneumoniae]|nr:hypothetical protein [Klebsiella pneumoniae]
ACDRVGYVYKILPFVGTIFKYPISLGTELSPKGICAGPDGNLWITDGLAGRVWVMDTFGITITSYAIGSAALAGICSGPDGNLWAADEFGYV